LSTCQGQFGFVEYHVDAAELVRLIDEEAAYIDLVAHEQVGKLEQPAFLVFQHYAGLPYFHDDSLRPTRSLAMTRGDRSSIALAPV
jgi:hypothetical protein